MDLDRLRRLAETEPERIARGVRERLGDAEPERIARQVREQMREYIDMNRRRFEPKRADPTPAVIAFGGGFALGLVAMYLLDPDEGPARRRRVQEMFRRVLPAREQEDTAYSADHPVYGSSESVYGPADATSGIAGSAPGGLGVMDETVTGARKISDSAPGTSDTTTGTSESSQTQERETTRTESA
jgi:hypothetical protein